MIRTLSPGELEQDLQGRLAMADQYLASRTSRRMLARTAGAPRAGRGRRGSRARKAGIGLIASLFVVGTALATLLTSNVGGFEIDANQGVAAVKDDLSTINDDAYYSGTFSTPGDDWVDGGPNNGLFALSGSAPHTAAADCYGSNIDINSAALVSNGGRYDDITFVCDGNADSKFGTGGSAILPEAEEDIVSPSGKQIDDVWPIKDGSIPGKDDFSHAYLAITSDHDSPCDADANTGDKILYLGAERGTNNGDAFWGFEFDQLAPTGFDNLKTHVTTDYSLDFNRTVGDVLVSFVQEGGGAAVLEIFKWNGSTFVLTGAVPACASLDPDRPQGDSLLATNTEFPAGGNKVDPNEQLAPPWNVPVCSPTITDGGTNTCRLASQTGGFGNGSAPKTAIASRLFFEAAIDMEAFGINNICANNAVITSRSAHPLESADIKDVAGATLNVCHPEIKVTKVPRTLDVCADSNTSVTYDYTVENTGNIDLTNVDIADDTIPGAQAAFELANGNSDAIAEGASVSFTLTAAINDTTTNIVTVDADSIAGPNTASDTATATVTAHDCTVTITKTVNLENVCIGSTVQYSYVVHNNSDEFTWTGDITDDNGTPGTPGDDFTVAANVVVGPGDDSTTYTHDSVIGLGSVTNTATADGDFDDADTTNATDTDTATTAGHTCTITLTKTPDAEDICSGGTVQYSYVVHNNSDLFIWTGAITDDNGTPGVPGDDFTVASGVVVGPGTDSTTYTHDSVIALGSVTNIASADGNSDDADATAASDTDDATVTGHDCTISITKTPNHKDVCTGSTTTITYTYEVTNNSDFFDASVDVEDDAGTPADSTDDVLVKDNLAVAAGATESFTYDFDVTGSVTNTATATATFNDDDSSTDTADASATVTGHDCTIEVTKTPDTTKVCNGSSTLVTYTYTVTNNSDLFDVVVDVVDDAGTPADNSDDVLVADDLAVAASTTSTPFTHGFTVSGSVTNTATATGTFNDPASSTDTADASATVNGHDCDITLTKTVDDHHVCAGNTVTYTYKVHNNSDEFTWTGDITDDNGTPGDNSDDFTVASGVVVGPGGDSSEYTHDSAIGLGEVTNTATADGNFDDADATAASDTDTATTEGHDCTIKITKTPSETNVCNGSTVDYDYLVTNNSDQFDWTGDVVDDAGTPGDTSDDVILANDVTIAAGDGLPLEQNGVAITGKVTNIVKADGVFNDPDATAASDTDTATVTGHDCSISITKTPSKETVCNGDTVNYSYTVTNNSDQFAWTGDVIDDAGTPADTSDDVVLANDVTIAAGDTKNYSLNNVVINGTVHNTVTADGAFNDPDATTGSDTADATVVGQPCGGGCTPGFWQGGNGAKLWNILNDPDWVNAGGAGTNPFKQSDTFISFFPSTGNSTVDNMTMLQIVGSGGTNVWPRKAARDLIAAYLNSSFGAGINYPYSTSQILADWNADRVLGTAGFQAFHAKYGAANAIGCSL